MITTGLVLTLGDDATLAARAVAALAARPEFTLGARTGRWLPVVMEAGDDAACRALHYWVESLPGVRHVDVASVNFEGPEPAPAAPPRPAANLEPHQPSPNP